MLRLANAIQVVVAVAVVVTFLVRTPLPVSEVLGRVVDNVSSDSKPVPSAHISAVKQTAPGPVDPAKGQELAGRCQLVLACRVLDST